MTLKSLLILAAVACSAKVGWAESYNHEGSSVNFYPSIKVWKYAVLNSAIDTKGNWLCIKDSETYTLDEFVKSGKFCEWRGKHEWILDHNLNLYECHICHRERKIIIVHKDIEELEP